MCGDFSWGDFSWEGGGTLPNCYYYNYGLIRSSTIYCLAVNEILRYRLIDILNDSTPKGKWYFYTISNKVKTPYIEKPYDTKD